MFRKQPQNQRELGQENKEPASKAERKPVHPNLNFIFTPSGTVKVGSKDKGELSGETIQASKKVISNGY